MSKRDEFEDEEREVLVECARRMAEIAAAPDVTGPWWDVADQQDEREYGPLYLPRDWFGGGESLPEKYRVRYLRAVYRLAERGYLELTAQGRRLAHVKLTPKGVTAAAKFAKRKKPAPEVPTR